MRRVHSMIALLLLVPAATAWARNPGDAFRWPNQRGVQDHYWIGVQSSHTQAQHLSGRDRQEYLRANTPRLTADVIVSTDWRNYASRLSFDKSSSSVLLDGKPAQVQLPEAEKAVLTRELRKPEFEARWATLKSKINDKLERWDRLKSGLSSRQLEGRLGALNRTLEANLPYPETAGQRAWRSDLRQEIARVTEDLALLSSPTAKQDLRNEFKKLGQEKGNLLREARAAGVSLSKMNIERQWPARYFLPLTMPDTLYVKDVTRPTRRAPKTAFEATGGKF